MKLKEKLDQCFQVLFKGRDFIKELQDAEEDYQAKLRDEQIIAALKGLSDEIKEIGTTSQELEQVAAVLKGASLQLKNDKGVV